MKKLLVFLCISALISCSEDQSTYETKWSADNKDSVVYVHHRNDDGTFSNFYMNYLIFNSLFRQGGYSSVNNYYQTHSTWKDSYSNRTYNTYKVRETPSSISSSPCRSGGSGFWKSSGSSSSSSSSTRSYSSPSRSSGSYSSPSRSYSSPSRSYSSPSRGGRR